MDKIERRIFVKKPSKAFKAPVASVFSVMDVPRRCMGDNDVNTPLPPDPWAQALYLPVHLPFGVLVRPTVVPARAFQSQNIFPLKLNQSVAQIDTPVRGLWAVTQIVIASNKVERHVKFAGHKG